MRFYILNSFQDIQCQNVPKTFGTPCITNYKHKDVINAYKEISNKRPTKDNNLLELYNVTQTIELGN